jgi:hypothetical protein
VIVAGSAPIGLRRLQTADREIVAKWAYFEVFVRNEILRKGDIRQRSPHAADCEFSAIRHTQFAGDVQ